MKKRSFIIAGAVAVLVIAVICSILLFQKDYDVYLILENDGFAITEETMTRTLTSKNLTKDTPDTTLVFGTAFAASDTVYERAGRLYLGEEKVALAMAYPLYVNAGTALFCVKDGAYAVTEDFEYVSTYPGLYIANGISFNSDMERAYREDFLFLQLPNGVYINTMPMTIKTSDLPGEDVAAASVVSFFESELRYYTLSEDGCFSFSRSMGLTADTKIEIDGTEYGYHDLLELLGLYEKEVEYTESVATKAPLPTPVENPKATAVPTAFIATGTPTPTVTPTKTPTQVPEEEVNVTAPATPKINTPVPEKENTDVTPAAKPTKTPVARVSGTPTPKPTRVPQTPLPAAPAADSDPSATAPGEAAPPAEPEAPAAPEEPEPVTPTNPDATIWVKPVVTLEGSFSPLVYSVKHASLVVENAAFLHKSGVVFEVVEPETGKLVTRKAFGGSASEVKLSGLRPETTYRVTVTMYYVDSKGGKQSEVIREGDLVTTLSMAALPKLGLNWSNGTLRYSNKAEFVEIKQKETQTAGELYEDLINNIAKIGLDFQAGRSMQSFWLNQKALTAFKAFAATDYMTPDSLKSNTEYTYTFGFYDKYGAAFALEGTYSGRISTAKKAPTASIKVTKNEVQNIALTITLLNPDDAWMDATYFVIKDKNGSLVDTAIYRDGVYEAATAYHTLAKEKTSILFDDLLDASMYTIEVYSDIDIADLRGTQTEQNIGSSKFVTSSITSLGLAYYEVGLVQVTAEEATVSVKLATERTNERLAALLDSYTITFAKVERGADGEIISCDPAGIAVTYVVKETQETTEPLPEGESLSEAEETFSESEETERGDAGEEASGTTDVVYTAENGTVMLATHQLESIHTTQMLFGLSGLESMSEYQIQIVPKVHMGTGKSETVREIRTNYAPETFSTLKKTPCVTIAAAYVTTEKIRLFDVAVKDTDGAVLDYPLSVQLYDEFGQIKWKKTYTAAEVANGNQVTEIKMEGLERYQEYTLRFFVAKYNDNAEKENDYEVNYELYYEPYVKTKEWLTFTTGDAVYGDLNFEGLSRQKLLREETIQVLVGKKGVTDLFTPYAMKRTKSAAYSTKTSDLSNIVYTSKVTNSYIDEPFSYYSHNDGANIYASIYKATIDFGDGCYNAISIGYMHNGGRPTVFRLYVEDPVTTNAAPVATLEIGANQTPGNNKIKWLDTTMLKAGAALLTGKQTVYLEEERLEEVGWMGHFCGVTFSYVEETKSEDTLFANLHVSIEDTKGQLGNAATYQIKVYKDGVLSDIQEHVYSSKNGVPAKTVKLYDVLHDTGEGRQYLETIAYEADDRICDINFYYEVERYGAKGKEYRFVLTTLIDGYEIVLDEVSFNSKTEILPIRTRADFLDLAWDASASYVAVNDIDMGTWDWNYTKINGSHYFYGTLDFQGHALTLNNKQAPMYILGTDGVIENIVLRYADTFHSPTSSALAYGNYGTIRNVVYERSATNAAFTYQQYQGGIVYENYGVIENFTISLQNDWYVSQYAGNAAYINYGTIRNGYVYGAAIRQLPEESLSSVQKTYALRIGGLVSINQVGAVVENCYTLIDLYASRAYMDGDGLCTLVGYNRGTVRNCFSVGSAYYKDASGAYRIQSNVNPLYKNTADVSLQVCEQLYLYAEEVYGKAAMPEVWLERSTLYDTAWYDLLFASETVTTADGFDTEPVRQAFYPHVVMPPSMPAQPWLSLPAKAEGEEPELLYTQVLRQEEDYAEALLTFYNPDRIPAQEIRIAYFDTANVVILGQYEDEEFWRVKIRVSEPEKCYSSYAIEGFTLGSAPGVIFYSKTYAAQEQKELSATFYHPVSSIADWIAINNDRSQNYRLYQDIDFALYPMEQVYIGNGKKIVATSTTLATNATNFTGILDGNGKTISNLDLRAYGGLFESVYGGTIKNLTVKNVDLRAVNEDAPVNLRRGLIRNMGNGAVIDNVHILGITLTGTEYTGALAALGGTYNTPECTIQNCSAHDVAITTTGTNTGSTQYIGGLVGYTSEILIIQNCYVDGLQIEAKDMCACGGIGGIAGLLYSGSVLENLYVADAKIDSFFQYTGGVVGAITERAYSNSYTMSNVYVDAEISSLSDILGGFVGYAKKRNQADKVNGLFLGTVTMKNTEFNYVSRYIGYKNFTTSLLTNAMYTMQETSYVNGRLNTADKDDSDVRNGDDVYTYLTREQLCDPDFYTKGVLVDDTFVNLDIGDSFALTYEKEGSTVTFAEQGQMPWLLSVDGTGVLPYQEYHSFQSNKIQVTEVASASNPGNAELFDVSVTITHPENYAVTGLVFDDNVEVASEPRFSVNGTKTTISYEIKAKGYVDRYYICGILGKEGNTDTQVSFMLDSMVPAQFLDIRSVDDWNEKMKQYKTDGYNVRILADLDFSGRSTYEENVTVNRVLGGNLAEENWVSIKNITRKTDNPLIANAYGSIQYVKFTDISMTKATLEKTRNFSIIGNANGNVRHVNFTNISIDASNRKGAGGNANNVALLGTLSGAASQIKLDGIYVHAFGTGILSTNTTGGLAGTMTGSASLSATTAKNLVVNGQTRTYTGGLVGRLIGATKLYNLTVCDFLVVGKASTGAIAGCADAVTYGRSEYSLTVSDGIVSGNVNVGGVIGLGYLVNKDTAPSTVENVLVLGEEKVGGVVGTGGASSNVTVKDSVIYGSVRVGGIVGFGNALATHCVDSVIGSVWARSDNATTNNLYQNALKAKRAEYAAMANNAASLSANQLAYINTVLTYFDEVFLATKTPDTTKYNNAYNRNRYTAKPAANSISQDASFGGIAGFGALLEANSVINCTIGCATAEYVGGVVGRVDATGYNTWNRTVRVFCNGCQNSTVTGATGVGGVVGIHQRYKVSNCYSNATVTATKHGSVTITNAGCYAGGIIGHMTKSSSAALSDTPQVYSVYFTGEVAGEDYVAGIIGRCAEELYGDNRNLLMAGVVELTAERTTGRVQMIGNRVANATEQFADSLVYEDAVLLTTETAMTATEYYAGTEPDAATGLLPSVQKVRDGVTLVTAADLQNKNTYSRTSGGVTTGFTASPSYWNFNGLKNGYMPYLTYYVYYGNTTAGKTVIRYQEGYTTNSSGAKTYAWKKYTGGIPVPGYTLQSMAFSLRAIADETLCLPELTAYAVDADKLNLEFSMVNADAYVTVEANGTTLFSCAVTKRVYTLQYDFKTTLCVTVTAGDTSCDYTIYPADVSPTVLVWNNEYYYITGNGIEGSRATIAGNFVSLAKGRALAADGTLYDVTTGMKTGTVAGVTCNLETTPLAAFTYEGAQILLYQGFSVVDGMVRDGIRLYVKEQTLYALDSALTPSASGVLLGKFPAGELTTILANDRTITDLTDVAVVLPEQFENSKIAQMTNNLDTDCHRVLVRYLDGGVAGFDFLTGKMLPIAYHKISESSYTLLGGTNTEGSGLAAIAAQSYAEIQSFESDLKASGWTAVDTNTSTDGTAAQEGDATTNGTAVENGTASENGTSLENGTSVENGTAVENGTSPENGTAVENGTLPESGTEMQPEGIQEEKNGAGTQAATKKEGEASVTANEEETDGQPEKVQGEENGAGTQNTLEQKGEISVTAPANKEWTKESHSSYQQEETRYVRFFDAEKNTYVLFEEEELLTSPAGSLTSVNEKVALSGHMIDKHTPFKAELGTLQDTNRNGLLLLFLTITGVAVLLVVLIYKHENGGKANEED